MQSVIGRNIMVFSEGKECEWACHSLPYKQLGFFDSY